MPNHVRSLTREQLEKLKRHDLQNVAKVRLLPLNFHMRHLPLYFALAKMLIHTFFARSSGTFRPIRRVK